MQPAIVTIDDDDEEPAPETSHFSSGNVCTVCGETPATMHYGALSCVGCKAFFRRALMKADQLECSSDENCSIGKNMRASCRSCRFKKCLKAGMKPAAVKPPREASNRQNKKAVDKPDKPMACTVSTSKNTDEWMKKMPFEMKTLLMSLLNIEAEIMKGDTNIPASELYPLKINTLKEMLEDSSKMNGKRSKMRYEPYRMAKNDELFSVAYRRVIAAIDWVERLAELIGRITTADKIALIKNCFAQLMVFKFATRTAEVTKDENILCLCNFCFVPRNISSAFNDTYHLGNGLIGRVLDELVTPLRAYGLREEEIVCVTAMIVLNPLARGLSEEGFTKIMDFRNKIHDVLYHIVSHTRFSCRPSISYSRLLLSLPIVASLANEMCENLQFAQAFSSRGEVPLLTDLFGCFSAEPLDDIFQLDNLVLSSNTTENAKKTSTKSTQTDHPRSNRKRHLDEPESPTNFQLLRAPAAFTLTEMFDDIYNAQNYPPARPASFLNSSPSTSALITQANNQSITKTCSLPNSMDQLPAQPSTSYQQYPPGNDEYNQSYTYYPNYYESPWYGGS